MYCIDCIDCIDIPGTPTFRMYGLSMLHCTEDNLQCTSHGFAPHNIWNMNWNPVDMIFGEILCSFVICGYHDLWWPLYVVICNVWGFVTIIICYNLWFVMIWFLMILRFWFGDWSSWSSWRKSALQICVFPPQLLRPLRKIQLIMMITVMMMQQGKKYIGEKS